MSYFKEAERFMDHIIHSMITKYKLPPEMGDEVADIFLRSERDFNTLVVKKSQREDVPISVDLINWCAENAIAQIFNDIIEDEKERDRRDNRSGYREHNLRNFSKNAPRYGSEGFLSGNKRGRYTDDDDLTKKYFKGGQRKEENSRNRKLTKGSGLFDQESSVSNKKGPSKGIMTDDVYTNDIVESFSLEKLNPANSSSFVVRSTSKITGETLKYKDSGLYDITRDVFVLKEGRGEEKHIKSDYISFSEDSIAFDCAYDMLQFLEAHLSKEDIIWPFIKTVEYRITEDIPYDHDTFFLSYDELTKNAIDKIGEPNFREDIFRLFDKYEDIVAIFHDIKDKDFQKVFEDYLLTHVNYKLRMLIRSSANDFKYSIKKLEDLSIFSRDPEFEKLQGMKKYEDVLKSILFEMIEIICGHGATHPVCFDHNTSFYVRSRKYMEIDTNTGSSSFDYWQYFANNKEGIKNTLIEKMKNRVLVSRPRRTIVSNVFSPQFIRMIDRSKSGILIPKKNDTTALFGLLNAVISTKPGSVPNDFLYMTNAKGEFRLFNLGLTLDDVIIVE